MMSFIIKILACATLYAIKGGSLNVFKNWNRLRKKNALNDFVLDGKVLSTLLFWALVVSVTADGVLATKLAVAWLISVAPSMGEEHGAIGDHQGAWGPYVERMPTLKRFGPLAIREGRDFGIKKGIQRGLVFGAAFTLAAGDVIFLWWCIAFVPAVFIGQCIHKLVFKQNGWALAEPIIGAAVVGVPLAIYVGT